jgi:hypothetical protein
MSYAIHSPGFFARAHDRTLDRYAIRHRRGFVTLHANINSPESPHIAQALGNPPLDGTPAFVRRPAAPNSINDVLRDVAECDRLHSSSLHGELASAEGR